jgi:uncharacterized OsmC-like protein
MDAVLLREMQAPLKSRYAADPAAAVRTLRASGHVDQKTITFALDTGRPGVPAGLHPATGGDGSAACSGDMLLEALVSCAGVTLASVATAMGIELTSATVCAEGEIDFRGTLGTSQAVPVGFSQIRLIFTIDTPAETAKMPKLLDLTERYCVVAQTIAHGVPIEMAVA